MAKFTCSSDNSDQFRGPEPDQGDDDDQFLDDPIVFWILMIGGLFGMTVLLVCFMIVTN